MKNLKKVILNTAIFIILWQVAHWLNLFSDKLPSLLSVAKAYINPNVVVEMLIALSTTLKYVAASLILGISIGYCLGIIIGLTPKVKSFSYSYLNGIKAIPVTVLLPLFLAVFGYQKFPIPIIAVPITAIIAVNIAQACEKTNVNRQSLAKLLAISKFNYWLHILRWETLDILFASLRIVITYALALQIAFEYFLQHTKGIGEWIYRTDYGQGENYLGNMYSAVILVAFVGIMFIKLLDLISKHQLKWKTQI